MPSELFGPRRVYVHAGENNTHDKGSIGRVKLAAIFLGGRARCLRVAASIGCFFAWPPEAKPGNVKKASERDWISLEAKRKGAIRICLDFEPKPRSNKHCLVAKTGVVRRFQIFGVSCLALLWPNYFEIVPNNMR